MRRRQLLEVHDQSWCPAVLRESLTETLALAHRWNGTLVGPAGALSAIAQRIGATRAVDLCSGAGAQVEIFAEALPDVHFTVTDRFPNRAALAALVARSGGRIAVIDTPVDARAPAQLPEHELRTIVTAFHHFPPDVARAILASAVEDRVAVFVVEDMPRSLLRFAALVVPRGLLAGLLHPLFSPRRRLLKALLTWVVPIAPLMMLFDGVVSTLRIYSPVELDEMVDGLSDDYVWEHGRARFGWWGVSTWFAGTPASG